MKEQIQGRNHPNCAQSRIKDSANSIHTFVLTQKLMKCELKHVDSKMNFLLLPSQIPKIIKILIMIECTDQALPRRGQIFPNLENSNQEYQYIIICFIILMRSCFWQRLPFKKCLKQKQRSFQLCGRSLVGSSSYGGEGQLGVTIYLCPSTNLQDKINQEKEYHLEPMKTTI